MKFEDDAKRGKAELVAGENGLMAVSRGPDRRGASLNFTPVPERIRAKYERPAVVARE